MADLMTNRKFLYIRWFLLRFGLVVYDLFAVSVSYYLALLVRFYVNYEFNIWAVKYVPAFFRFAPYYGVSCLVVFAALGMYKSLWKYASLSDMNRILTASILTCAIQVAGTLLFVMRMPLSYYGLGAAFQFVLITISRFSYRLLLIERDRISKWKSKKQGSIRIMIVGTGESSRTVIKHLERDMNNVLCPACVVDFEHDTLRGTMVGIPVIGGVNNLEHAARKYQVDRVVLADSAMPEQIRKEVRMICKEIGVAVQSFSEYFQSSSGKIYLKTMLEYVSGPVVLKIGQDEFAYDNSEQAALSTTEKYVVSSVFAKEGVLQLELVQDVLLPNDVQADWVEYYREETGEDISFF